MYDKKHIVQPTNHSKPLVVLDTTIQTISNRGKGVGGGGGGEK